MTTANKLTILRVLMIPAFLVVLYWGFPGCRYVALGIYIVNSVLSVLAPKIRCVEVWGKCGKSVEYFPKKVWNS